MLYIGFDSSYNRFLVAAYSTSQRFVQTVSHDLKDPSILTLYFGWEIYIVPKSLQNIISKLNYWAEFGNLKS